MSNFSPDPQAPVERQQVVKTISIGSTGADVPDDSFKAKFEAQKKKIREQLKSSSAEEQASKAKAEMLDKAGERRHLKYEVIETAAIVQISVINSEDGSIVRKVPPDKVVEFVARVKEKKKKSQTARLDLKA